MITVHGNPILATEQEVIEALRDQCAVNGLFLFKVIRPSGLNVMTTCPFHKEGQERRPSFGVYTRDMSCHCFTCGWAGSLDTMISNVFGYDDGGAFGRKWLSKNFLSLSIENRKPLDLNLSRGSARPIVAATRVNEEEIDKYRYIHPYMYERGLTDEVIEMFDVGYDSVTSCLTFPVLDLNKVPVFIARRSVRYKYFNYPEGTLKPVYGAYLFTTGEYKEAIICESILNALTCWVYNKPAVALLGTGAKEQYDILRKLPVRKYILAMDPDEAGQRATQRLRQELGTSKVLTSYQLPEGKDLNDLRENILNLLEYF